MRKTKAQKEMEQKRKERRALNHAIAEKVFGWIYRAYGNGGGEWKLNGKIVAYGDAPDFSEDIAKAWLVVEKLVADGYEPHVEYHILHKDWQCRLQRYKRTASIAATLVSETAISAPTPPLAICLAALKAVGA